jgi:voltage-gated potassium channel
MAWLGVIFGLAALLQFAPLRPTEAHVLEFVIWALWALFLVEFLARVALAEHRGTYVRRHWLQVVMLALPTLRLFSLLRLVRLGRAVPAARVISSSFRSSRSTGALLGSRLGYLAGIASVALIGLAELAFVVAGDDPSGAFRTFHDTLLWTGSTVIGNQGDPVPESAIGRLLMDVGFMLGLVLFATLAGALGAYFLGSRASAVEADRQV